MRNGCSKLLVVGLMGCLSAVYGAGGASAQAPAPAKDDTNEHAAQEFKNISKTQWGYDLTLYFTQKLKADPDDTTVKADWPTVEQGGTPPTPPDSISADGLSAHWNSVPGGPVAPGAGTPTLLAKFKGPKAKTDPNDPNKTIPGIALDFVNSSFSMDDTNHHTAIRGSVGSAGQAAGIFFHREPSGQFYAYARFFNPESVPVVYNNIQFFVNNHMANFSSPQFALPTGPVVPGIPHQIIVPPGQFSPPLPLGPLNPTGYVLGLATAASADHPGTSYRVAGAAVPSIPAQPIALAGFNADVIVDQDPTARFAHPFDANTFAWFETGAVDDHGVRHQDGLPAGLLFTSVTDSGATYYIQPANGANVLQLSPYQTGTLWLTAPCPYFTLNLLASSGDGTPTSTGGGTINFADGSTQLFNLNLFDWHNGLGNFHPEAVLPGPNGQADVGASGTNFHYVRECDFQVYETVVPIDPWHAGIPILSIDFTGAPDAFYSNIFGVSGK